MISFPTGWKHESVVSNLKLFPGVQGRAFESQPPLSAAEEKKAKSGDMSERWK